MIFTLLIFAERCLAGTNPHRKFFFENPISKEIPTTLVGGLCEDHCIFFVIIPDLIFTPFNHIKILEKLSFTLKNIFVSKAGS